MAKRRISIGTTAGHRGPYRTGETIPDCPGLVLVELDRSIAPADDPALPKSGDVVWSVTHTRSGYSLFAHTDRHVAERYARKFCELSRADRSKRAMLDDGDAFIADGKARAYALQKLRKVAK